MAAHGSKALDLKDVNLALDQSRQQLDQIYGALQNYVTSRLTVVAASEVTPKLIAAEHAKFVLILNSIRNETRPLIAQIAHLSYIVGKENVASAIKDIAAVEEPNAVTAQQIIAENMTTTLEQAELKVGSRSSEVLRQVALQQISDGMAEGQSLVQTRNALETALKSKGIVSPENLLSINGRNYQLRPYAEMVARTTSREASTWGTINTLKSAGLDLVTVDGASDDICADYIGNTYSISGEAEGYDQLGTSPPYHPNCQCVLRAASA